MCGSSRNGSAPWNVDIRARVQGYIQEIAFKEGSAIKEGDLLLRIDPRPYEAALAQAKAGLGQLPDSKKLIKMRNVSQNFSTRKSPANRITRMRCKPILRRRLRVSTSISPLRSWVRLHQVTARHKRSGRLKRWQRGCRATWATSGRD
jgi:multidrug resistance efflux pump